MTVKPPINSFMSYHFEFLNEKSLKKEENFVVFSKQLKLQNGRLFYKPNILDRNMKIFL